MASIGNDPNGAKRILFVGADRKRYTVRLGKVPVKTALAVARKVEALNAAKLMQQPPDDETARWLASIDSKLHDRLAAVGLASGNRGCSTLDAFIGEYIASRTDIKPNTLAHLERARRDLVKHFGANKPIGEITLADADEFRRQLLTRMADNTVRRICGRAKQFFRHAVRKRLIRESPFADMKGTAVLGNRGREFFVSRETAAKVMDACPDAQWRLLFALSRFGGLRCPSEHLLLRWGDVDWERSRIRVTSPKTAHHDGKDHRWIPIFPELREPLETAWEQADEGAELVITRYRDANANLRTQLLRIIDKAGAEPWPKLFQNLRSTRQTELAERFPAHVVCSWLGNSQAVAAKHYLQVTDEHFSSAAQNPAQSGAVQGGTEQQAKTANASFTEAYGSIPNSTGGKAPRKEPSSKQYARLGDRTCLNKPVSNPLYGQNAVGINVEKARHRRWARNVRRCRIQAGLCFAVDIGGFR